MNYKIEPFKLNTLLRYEDKIDYILSQFNITSLEMEDYILDFDDSHSVIFPTRLIIYTGDHKQKNTLAFRQHLLNILHKLKKHEDEISH